MRRFLTPGLICGCAVVGAGLVALPWVERPQAQALPGEWSKGSRTHALVTLAAAAVDRACRNGDVAGLQRTTSRRYFGELQALLGGSGRRLDEATLRQQKVHVGGVGRLPLLIGVAGADAAVAVFERERVGFEHEAQAQALLALRFAWDGFELRLDGKVSRTVPPGDSMSIRARTLAIELLASR